MYLQYYNIMFKLTLFSNNKMKISSCVKISNTYIQYNCCHLYSFFLIKRYVYVLLYFTKQILLSVKGHI